MEVEKVQKPRVSGKGEVRSDHLYPTMASTCAADSIHDQNLDWPSLSVAWLSTLTSSPASLHQFQRSHSDRQWRPWPHLDAAIACS